MITWPLQSHYRSQSTKTTTKRRRNRKFGYMLSVLFVSYGSSSWNQSALYVGHVCPILWYMLCTMICAASRLVFASIGWHLHHYFAALLTIHAIIATKWCWRPGNEAHTKKWKAREKTVLHPCCARPCLNWGVDLFSNYPQQQSLPGCHMHTLKLVASNTNAFSQQFQRNNREKAIKESWEKKFFWTISWVFCHYLTVSLPLSVTHSFLHTGPYPPRWKWWIFMGISARIFTHDDGRAAKQWRDAEEKLFHWVLDIIIVFSITAAVDGDDDVVSSRCRYCWCCYFRPTWMGKVWPHIPGRIHDFQHHNNVNREREKLANIYL